MKSLYLLLTTIFLLFYAKTDAQEWAPLGAEWRYRSELSPTDEVWYELIRVEKDTIVADQPCRKYVVYDDAPNWDNPIVRYDGFTFERNDSIFFWHQDNFYLRYDFSALPGDTILIPTPDFGLDPGTTDSFIVVLDSIKIVSIGLSQTPLQKYYTHSIAGTLNYFDNGYYRTIGSKSVWGGLTTDEIPVGLIYYDLRCYIDDDNEILGIDMNCGLPDAVNERITADQLKLYPNPVRDLLQIAYHTSLSGADYRLLNQLGEVVITGVLPSLNTQLDLQMNHLPSGIWWLEVLSDNKRGVWEIVKL